MKRQINEVLGATINQITNKDLNSFKVILPTNDKEEQAISTVLADMEQEITWLQTQLEKTRLIKQGMMQELFTGRIRLI